MSILNEARAIDLGLSSAKDNDELGVLRSIDFLTEQGTKYINKGLEPDAKRAIISIRGIGNAAALQKMELGVLISIFLWEGWLRLQGNRKCPIQVSVSFIPSMQSGRPQLTRRWKRQSGSQLLTSERLQAPHPSREEKRISRIFSCDRSYRKRNIQAKDRQGSGERRPSFSCIRHTSVSPSGQ